MKVTKSMVMDYVGMLKRKALGLAQEKLNEVIATEAKVFCSTGKGAEYFNKYNPLRTAAYETLAKCRETMNKYNDAVGDLNYSNVSICVYNESNLPSTDEAFMVRIFKTLNEKRAVELAMIKKAVENEYTKLERILGDTKSADKCIEQLQELGYDVNVFLVESQPVSVKCDPIKLLVKELTADRQLPEGKGETNG